MESIVVHNRHRGNLSASLTPPQKQIIAFDVDSISHGYWLFAASQFQQFNSSVILQHHHALALPAAGKDHSFQPNLAAQPFLRTQGICQLSKISDYG